VLKRSRAAAPPHSTFATVLMSAIVEQVCSCSGGGTWLTRPPVPRPSYFRACRNPATLAALGVYGGAGRLQSMRDRLDFHGFRHYHLPQQCLYFLPLPQGRIIAADFGAVRTGLASSMAAAASGEILGSAPACCATKLHGPRLRSPMASPPEVFLCNRSRASRSGTESGGVPQ